MTVCEKDLSLQKLAIHWAGGTVVNSEVRDGACVVTYERGDPDGA